jgi:cyclic beta-1,2-glucan synthetase
MINPISHSDTPEATNVYKVEPYVVAADIYTAKGHLGRGGWTWYTGSASWMYRIGLESILGFKLRGTSLFIEPCVPASWKEFTIDYRFGSATYVITVTNPDGIERGTAEITLDGSQIDGGIPLVDDGARHNVTALLRSSSLSSSMLHQPAAARR